MPNLKARELRKNLTDAESVLWRYLRLRQFSPPSTPSPARGEGNEISQEGGG
ncbi:MAG: DUF559 domain-containing protein [Candidatus Methylomirabilales bacterium]